MKISIKKKFDKERHEKEGTWVEKWTMKKNKKLTFFYHLKVLGIIVLKTDSS